jgi:hypothetical protein
MLLSKSFRKLRIVFGTSIALTHLSLPQVLTASFIIRLYDFADDVIFPTSLPTALDKLPNFSKWAKACATHDSVTYIWDKEERRQGVIKRLPQARERLAKLDARIERNVKIFENEIGSEECPLK